MSMHEFHSQLAGRKESLLLSALRMLTQVADPKSFFSTDAPMGEWPIWDEGGGPPPSLRLATDAV